MSTGANGVPAIAVLDYGIGNLRSAEKALQHCGADARLVADPDLARLAPAVVLPGVGSFGPCMDALRSSGLDRVVLDAVAEGRPLLGICVGMQLLYEGSDESTGVAGLGVFPGVLRRLSPSHQVPSPEHQLPCPQMQWNRLDAPDVSHPMLAGLGSEVWMYFVHSYAAPDGPEVIATCDYGGVVVAAIARGALWATQFHPEKSGTAGLSLLANFVAASRVLPVGTPA